MLSRYRLVFALTLALGIVGCIISGQFVIIFPLNQTINTTDQAMDYLFIDLTSNSTWNDHQDDIQGIVDIKFEARFTNNLGSEATGEIWISAGDQEYTTVEEVRANATAVLRGIAIAANSTREISFTESADFIENLETVLDLAETGTFYIYGIAGDLPFSLTIDGVAGQTHARLLITFSAG
jgi:hypothetical protein